MWSRLAMDGLTGVSDTVQVLIFILGVGKSYDVYEDILDIDSVHDTTSGEVIFMEVENFVYEKMLRWKNLKCIIIDAGKSICGKNKEVVAYHYSYIVSFVKSPSVEII